MNPETGEIQNFPKFIPAGWEGLPEVGDAVEVIILPSKRRGQIWRVVELLERQPGRMVLEPVTVKRQQK